MTVNKKVIAVIPARFGSTRFPGKPLANILGKTLIQRTYENTCRSRLVDEVVVATDDERIYHHVESFGGKVEMTSPSCPTGTDRVAEVIKKRYHEASIVVNVQGDEPCLEPSVIDSLVEDLQANDQAVLTTPVVPLHHMKDILSPTVVKCVFGASKQALYFSRTPLPHAYKEVQGTTYYRHVGVYCFRREFLLRYTELPVTPLQRAEDLEQLKVLEHGYPIFVSIVEDEGIGVDTLEDLKRVEARLCKENTYLSQAALSPR